MELKNAKLDGWNMGRKRAQSLNYFLKKILKFKLNEGIQS
jgi:hypothetical protein